jgi:hypothetical protein
MTSAESDTVEDFRPPPSGRQKTQGPTCGQSSERCGSVPNATLTVRRLKEPLSQYVFRSAHRHVVQTNIPSRYNSPNDFHPSCSVIPFRLDQLPWSRFHLLVVWILDGLEITIVGSLGPALQSVLSDADHTDGRVVFDFLFCLGSREFRLFDGQRDLSARDPLSHASTHWARPSAEVRRRSGLAGSSSLVRPGA